MIGTMILAFAATQSVGSAASFEKGSNETYAPPIKSDICQPQEVNFMKSAEKFARFHQDDVNVAFHLLTTPLGFVGAVAIGIKLARGSALPVSLLLVLYAGSLLVHFPVADGEIPSGWSSTLSPRWLVFETIAVLLGVLVAACQVALLNWFFPIMCLVVGFFGQDLAHWYTREETFLNAYTACASSGTDWLAMFYEHCYYLIPLCLYVAKPLGQTLVSSLPLMMLVWGNISIDSFCRWWPGSISHSRVVTGKVSTDSQRKDMELIRKWVREQCPRNDTSTHWWPTQLPEAEFAAFQRLEWSEDIIKSFRKVFHSSNFDIDIVRGMNEVYVTGPNRKGNSDQVFFTRHVDGPWCMFPFCSVYRTILALDMNTEVTTHFPLHRTGCTLQTGEYSGFDFHREPHYISADGSKANTDHRVILKLHYVTYPKTMRMLGLLLSWMSTKYNQAFRALFLYTIVPQTKTQQFVADMGVVLGTKLYHGLEFYLGFANILFLVALAGLAWATEVPAIFLYGTSFVHYYCYITTYYRRDDVSFVSFQRDVLLFKSVALIQIMYIYMGPYLAPLLAPIFPSLFQGFPEAEVWLSSLAMIVVGYSISLKATWALGKDVTYFGIELGQVDKPKQFVTSFPYNVIPHPMILSQILALQGFHLVPHVHERFPYLIPVHVSLYMIHMAQEHFDFHA